MISSSACPRRQPDQAGPHRTSRRRSAPATPIHGTVSLRPSDLPRYRPEHAHSGGRAPDLRRSRCYSGQVSRLSDPCGSLQDQLARPRPPTREALAAPEVAPGPARPPASGIIRRATNDCAVATQREEMESPSDLVDCCGSFQPKPSTGRTHGLCHGVDFCRPLAERAQGVMATFSTPSRWLANKS